MAIINYAPKIPIEIDDNGKYSIINDALKNARQKLTMLVLTNPGEKIMDPKFGLGIKRYLFESSEGIIKLQKNEFNFKEGTSEDIRDIIFEELSRQTAKYCEDITINDISLEIQENTMLVQITYNYKNYLTDNINISVGI